MNRREQFRAVSGYFECGHSLKKRGCWFRVFGYGLAATHKDDALFSLRNGYTKSVLVFGYHIHFLKP